MAMVMVFALSKMLGFKTPSFWNFAMPALVTGVINYFGFESFFRLRLRRCFRLEARGRPSMGDALPRGGWEVILCLRRSRGSLSTEFTRLGFRG